LEVMRSDQSEGDLELVRLFVNTLELDTGVDEIGTPGELDDWLRAHALLPGGDGSPTRPADLERAHATREALRCLLLANNGEVADTAEAQDVLTAVAERATLGLRFSHGRAELRPGARGVDRALGEILVLVHGAMADGRWPRLKACRADTCQWAFYDSARNGSRQWCSMAVCGNREKARNFRLRQAASQATPDAPAPPDGAPDGRRSAG
jgi:predicted RNA-binding Zn ribbon-like protein